MYYSFFLRTSTWLLGLKFIISWSSWSSTFCSFLKQLYVDGFFLLFNTVSYRNHIINKIGCINWLRHCGIWKLVFYLLQTHFTTTFHRIFCCFTPYAGCHLNSLRCERFCVLSSLTALLSEHNQTFLLGLTKFKRKIFIKTSSYNFFDVLIEFS